MNTKLQIVIVLLNLYDSVLVCNSYIIMYNYFKMIKVIVNI